MHLGRDDGQGNFHVVIIVLVCIVSELCTCMGMRRRMPKVKRRWAMIPYRSTYLRSRILAPLGSRKITIMIIIMAGKIMIFKLKFLMALMMIVIIMIMMTMIMIMIMILYIIILMVVVVVLVVAVMAIGCVAN